MLRQAYGHFFDLTIVNNDIGETISALEAAIEKVHSTPQQWIPVSWLYWQDSELELAESCDECMDDECDCEYCDINESNYEMKWEEQQRRILINATLQQQKLQEQLEQEQQQQAQQLLLMQQQQLQQMKQQQKQKNPSKHSTNRVYYR